MLLFSHFSKINVKMDLKSDGKQFGSRRSLKMAHREGLFTTTQYLMIHIGDACMLLSGWLEQFAYFYRYDSSPAVFINSMLEKSATNANPTIILQSSGSQGEDIIITLCSTLRDLSLLTQDLRSRRPNNQPQTEITFLELSTSV